MERTGTAPYGTWKSPVTSDLIVSETIGLGQIVLDGEDVYWQEMRPSEGGRYVVVRQKPDGSVEDVIPSPFNARTRVHEYGGGGYTVNRGTLFFSNYTDQRIYRIDPGREPRPVTPELPLRYADLSVDGIRNRVLCVCEDHTEPGPPTNTVAAADLETGEVTHLVAGNDFYASPRLSPDGTRLAWLTWNHPNMPWDGTELWTAPVDETGRLGDSERVAGGPTESIFQPEWGRDGVLFFISDRSGWWNIYRRADGEVRPVLEMEADFGLPQWVFGMSTYQPISSGSLIGSFTQEGIRRLVRIDTATGEMENLRIPYTDVDYIRGEGDQVFFLGASHAEPRSVVRMNLMKHRITVFKRAFENTIDPGYLSAPEPVAFPTTGEQIAHGFFYRPKNKAFEPPKGEKPPLLVFSHGGPTAATSAAFNLTIQYWTSRGIAVLDVNYGGSTGYGREYRERLRGNWGVVDVDDCTNGTRFLVSRGDVDGDRLAIRGGSAGGYTTLAVLTFRDLFKAGASYFGVSDPEALAKETHKFESRYLDGLIGPYPERRDLYIERAPIHSAHQLSCPVIFLQGLEDEIVPANQAEKMVEILKEKGIPVAYLPFEGEQHGFRRSENIKRALDAEFYFYARIFGYTPADSIEPVPIANL